METISLGICSFLIQLTRNFLAEFGVGRISIAYPALWSPCPGREYLTPNITIRTFGRKLRCVCGAQLIRQVELELIIMTSNGKNINVILVVLVNILSAVTVADFITT